MKKHTVKFTALLLAAVMLTGCGGQSSKTGKDTNSAGTAAALFADRQTVRESPK